MLKIDSLLSDLSQSDNIDILLLPEMAFTGYTFKDKSDIRPYLE
jgi:protein N-terminal amidase